MSKTAAALLAVVTLAMLSVPMSAQLLPNGNAYAGYSYGQLTNAVIQQSYPKGWNGSVEVIPFARFLHFGFVLDGSGFYRSNLTQYNGVAGPRLSTNYGKWRPFIQGMGGIRHLNSSGFVYNPVCIDVGAGADYKLPFRSFSWRLQTDFMRTHYLGASQYDYRVSTGVVWRF